eukprot:TRINITY_DN5793_c0_g1_i1.p1 TRINITY_DN5793_c0_g1~~TRINITY_DN5793_c0_g1_i1.p1  ORF type:complete len:449 (-),score=62.83 TRINITY_DN5793_c0_g1_i1:935-2281(-)
MLGSILPLSTTTIGESVPETRIIVFQSMYADAITMEKERLCCTRVRTESIVGAICVAATDPLSLFFFFFVVEHMAVCAVLGGNGFMGSHLVRLLVSAESPLRNLREVRVLDIAAPKTVHPSETDVILTQYPCNVEDYPALCRGLSGAEIVFHCASVVDFLWREAVPERLYNINTKGTWKVIQACKEAGVRTLVYTSTIDVVARAGRHMRLEAGEDDCPIPQTLRDFAGGAYAQTKAWAEEAVLLANGTVSAGGRVLRTVALRPCGMFGEGDPYHVSATLRGAAQGMLLFRMGAPSTIFLHNYAGNVAHAHATAAAVLHSESARAGDAAGRAYFVADNEPPSNFFDFMEPFLQARGFRAPPKHRYLPWWFLYAVASLLELIWNWLRALGVRTPPLLLTRIAVLSTCFTMAASDKQFRAAFGWEPPVSPAVAHQRTLAWTRSLPDSFLVH